MIPGTDAGIPPSISRIFEQAAASSQPRAKRKRAAPFSLRLTLEELAKLEQAAQAAGLALATYIKLRLFNNLPP